MQQTETYKLNLIDPADVFSPDPLNDNARKLDAALAEQKQTAAANKSELDTALAGKAPQSEITRLETALNSKAAQTEIGRLETTLTEQQKTITANKTEVDTALKGKAPQSEIGRLETALNSKAPQTEITRLETALNAKAAQSEITRLETVLKDKAAQSEITRLETALNAKAPQTEIGRLETALNANASKLEELSEGQLRFKIGTYIGDGGYGAEHKWRLEFDFKPILLFLFCTTELGYGGVPWMRDMSRGVTQRNNSGSAYAVLTWEDHAVSWFSDGSAAGMNKLDSKYIYFALGCAK